MVEPIVRGGDVALFIDWENFKISLAAGNRNPNLSSLKEEVSNQGRVVVAKAYADWVTRAPELRGASQFINDPPSLYAAGIEPVFVPTRIPSTHASTANGMRTYRVKNSVDVKMTADCIECAHSYPNIGTFVLVSGDSDFLHVVNALRTMGKRVVIIGVSWSTSRRLADQVDSLLLYDKDVDPLAPQPAVLPQHANRPSLSPAAQNEVPELAEVISAIEEIIREERAAGGQPLLTAIKQRMMRRYPNFDEKKLGFSGFKKLMARAAEEGNIKLVHSGLVDWAILADEEVPEGTTEETPAGVASRSGRRRGGRRRHGGQRDSEASDGADDAIEDTDADDDAADTDEGIEPGQVVSAFVDSLEETAATDFDIPEPAEVAEALTSGSAAAQTAENEVAVPWFDADEEVGAEPESVAGQPVAETEEPAPDPEDEPEPTAGAEELDNVFGDDSELADAVQQVVASISLPAGPGDGLNPERITDLVVMADHLEHREGARHVAFTYLVDEVCAALEQGLEAGSPQIIQRWTGVVTKDYVSKTLRGMEANGMFRRPMISWRENDQRRQRRLFNLVRTNDLVERILTARLGPDANSTPPADPPTPEATTVVEARDELPAMDDVQPAEDQTQPVEDQITSVNGNSADEPETEPQPVAVSADTPQPVDDDAEDDEVYDEPQPRSTRRRRPFTSRLLGR